MKVEEAMTRDVRVVRPDDTIRQAAFLMMDIDAGALPVTENEKMIGMITDRDIAVRAVALGKSSETQVRDVMSGEIRYCFGDQDTDEVAMNMADQQIRRLPVVDRDKRLIGIISLGDLAHRLPNGAAGEALAGISQPGGEHRQGAQH